MFDLHKLKQLELDFLMQYPKGFADPEMEKIGKKHNVNRMSELAKECFSKRACSNVHTTSENMVKVISRSSMVSLFEKPKFRDFVQAMDENEKAFMVNALVNMLHGKKQLGFEAMVDILKTGKLAKWSLISIIPAYYEPSKEVFVKPTTAKMVLKHFAIDDPIYKSTPNWDFYKKYRKLINDAKGLVDESLSPSNAAFSGFLMMTVKK
jgi:hypothetical protein